MARRLRSNRTNVKSGVSALSSTSSAFGTAASSARLDEHGGQIDEALRRQVLAEEEAAMNQYKAKVSSPTTGPSTNPFLSSPTITSSVDLFAPVDVSSLQQQQSSKASDDLLQLSGNPFADMFGSAPAPAAAPASVPGANSWMSNGFAGGAAPAPMANNAFAIFGDAEATSNGSVFDALGEVLQPAGGSSVAVSAAGAAQSASGKVLTGDLDSSLASLAENLSMNKGAQQNVKGVQWNSPKNTAKAGGVAGGWTPQPMAATTGANYRPMQGMPGMAPVQGMAGMAPQGMAAQPAPGMVPGMGAMRPGAPAGVPMMGGGAGGGSMGPAQPGQPIQAQPQTMDPFGAL